MADLQSILVALSDQLAVQHAPLLAYERRALQYGNRISHLPVDPRLVEAWLRVTSSPFFHPHAVALSSLRRGEHFAVFGPTTVADDCLHLMALERLSAQPESTVVLIAPDAAAVRTHERTLRALSRAMEPGPAIAALSATPDRAVARARLLVLTATDLDQRLLQHHQRSLQPFIQRLDLVLISGFQRLNGIAALHLQYLLQRLERLCGRYDLQYGLTSVDLQLPTDALNRLAAGNWRSITLDEGPRAAHALAVWQTSENRLDTVVTLAEALAPHVESLHVVAHPAEAVALQARLTAIAPAISVSDEVRSARALIFSSPDLGARRSSEALAGDAELTVVCVGASPIDQIVARSAQQPPDRSWFRVRPEWFGSIANSYVTARHLLCSAAERPVTSGEVQAWQLEDYVDQLTHHAALIAIPADAGALIPGHGSEPYAAFDLQVPAGAAARIGPVDAAGFTADPAGYDRWLFADAALPPLRGGLRVTQRDDAALRVEVAPDSSERRTLPLRRCRVTVREQRNERSLAPLHRLRVGLGRVLVNEEIVAYLAGQRDQAQRTALPDPAALTWMSSAIWIELPLQHAVTDQQIGWSLAATLPLFSCAALTDVVPLYDETSQRLYLVDAQPAGSGLAEWLYRQIESLLPTAYEIALEWQHDAVMRETAEVDLEWLLTLLDRQPTDVLLTAHRQSLTVAATLQAAELPAARQAGTANAVHRTESSSPAAPARPQPALREVNSTAAARNDTVPRRSALLPAGLVPPRPPPAADTAPSAVLPTPVGESVQRSAQRKLMRKGNGTEQPDFHVGDRVSCSPYGSGVVRAITLDGSRRLLTIHFGEYGELPIDPALSPLRLIARARKNSGRNREF